MQPSRKVRTGENQVVARRVDSAVDRRVERSARTQARPEIAPGPPKQNKVCRVGPGGLGILLDGAREAEPIGAALRDNEEHAMGNRTFKIFLIKPSHYDDDGYVIQWRLSTIPSN